jgi:ABC-2 type transport system ATP-binding protein
VGAIELSGLRKRYGSVDAVAGIDLEVATGELVAVLGPNGAGKTTTIQILEGLTPRTAGDVRVLGVDPERAGRDFRDRIGVMLQECVTEPLLRVGELVDLHRSFYRRPRPADAVLRLVGLAGSERAMVRTLSGGQQRRVDLALALVGDPELVFLDEPTTGFDPEARRRAWDVIATLQDDGVTILLSTHYLEEAEQLADRIVVLAHGRIVAEGPPRTLGDRAARAGRIALDPIAGVDPDDLPVLVELAEGRWRVRCDDVTTALHDLTGWALTEGHRLEGLTVAGATLDDIYSEVVA